MYRWTYWPKRDALCFSRFANFTKSQETMAGGMTAMANRDGLQNFGLNSTFLRCFSAAPAGDRCPSLAGSSIQQSEWARAYYEHPRKEKNQSHHAAVRSLAFKWLRIIYRCWKDGEPYDEEIYRQSLRRRGSLLAGVLGRPTLAAWQSVGGFQKFSENNT